jgi:hypothetical protein
MMPPSKHALASAGMFQPSRRAGSVQGLIPGSTIYGDLRSKSAESVPSAGTSIVNSDASL